MLKDIGCSVDVHHIDRDLVAACIDELRKEPFGSLSR
jgi:hypothetical protein